MWKVRRHWLDFMTIPIVNNLKRKVCLSVCVCLCIHMCGRRCVCAYGCLCFYAFAHTPSILINKWLGVFCLTNEIYRKIYLLLILKENYYLYHLAKTQNPVIRRRYKIPDAVFSYCSRVPASSYMFLLMLKASISIIFFWFGFQKDGCGYFMLLNPQ